MPCAQTLRSVRRLHATLHSPSFSIYPHLLTFCHLRPSWEPFSFLGAL